ncbi:hypothetical protein OIO90_003117 [Microbotryomycetes sp. JL221]|nr:hypothetical protein OIO90_003117 [Microbotryomycetes sp. JL221]
MDLAQPRHVTDTRLAPSTEDSLTQSSLSNVDSSWQSIEPLPQDKEATPQMNGQSRVQNLVGEAVEQSPPHLCTTSMNRAPDLFDEREPSLRPDQVESWDGRANIAKWLHEASPPSACCSDTGLRGDAVSLSTSGSHSLSNEDREDCLRYDIGQPLLDEPTWISEDLPVKVEDVTFEWPCEDPDDKPVIKEQRPEVALVINEKPDVDDVTKEELEGTASTSAAQDDIVFSLRWVFVTAFASACLAVTLLAQWRLGLLDIGSDDMDTKQGEHVFWENGLPLNVSIVPVARDDEFALAEGPTLHIGWSWTAAFGTSFFLATCVHSLMRNRSQSKKHNLVNRRTREESPLLTLTPSSVTRARELLESGEWSYQKGRWMDAENDFRQITGLACAAIDKTNAWEWLGRTLYKQKDYEGARAAFERVLMRSRTAVPTARASLGRTKYRLGLYNEAARELRGAIKRDSSLTFAHEYLGKALFATNDVKMGQIHLEQGGCSAWAFLGERLHLLGQLTAAERALKKALELRHDYPAAHARLALVYGERINKEKAAEHWRHVIATREAGLFDQDLCQSTRELLCGSRPYLSLILALDGDKEQRLRVAQQARQKYPSEMLLRILVLILEHRTIKEMGQEEQGSRARENLVELKKLRIHLIRRVAKLKSFDHGGDHSRGLLAIVELGLAAEAQSGAIDETPLSGLEGSDEARWIMQVFDVLKRTQ